MRKQTLMSLSLSYQKKDWRVWPCPSFFWHVIDFSRILILKSWCHTKRRMGASFFWYDNDKDLKVCFLVTYVITVLNEEVGETVSLNWLQYMYTEEWKFAWQDLFLFCNECVVCLDSLPHLKVGSVSCHVSDSNKTYTLINFSLFRCISSLLPISMELRKGE